MENISIYEELRIVPPEAKKEIKAGRLKGMTDINPMWRIKRLTEKFGPCGVGWWYEITAKWIETDEITKQKAGFVDINLYYIIPETGEVSRPIPGTGGAAFVAQESKGPYLSDEVFKMALTDAISVACKALGMAADVYYERDRSKYDREEGDPTPPPPPKEPERFICSDCGQIIKPWVVNGVTKMSVREIAQNSEKEFRRRLCVDCAKKANARIEAERAAANTAPPYDAAANTAPAYENAG